MPERAAVDWLLIAVCAVTYALLIGELGRLARRALRLKERAERLADSPLAEAGPKAEAAAARIAAASLEGQALVERAAVALARIGATVRAVISFRPRRNRAR
jgi:hypothetical protein